jgi:cob(I)alamin adenosyltransferase
VVHLYIGDGKGKTSAAIGLAVRAAGAGLRVAIVFFDKGESSTGQTDEVYSERAVLRSIPNIELFSVGLPRFCPDRAFRQEMTEEDVREAQRGYELSARLIGEKSHDAVILDEILVLVRLGALSEEQIIGLMDLSRRPPETELILTGRADSPLLTERANLVTDMRKVKHYFDSGAPARKGIEY